jgi:hypothetical protein
MTNQPIHFDTKFIRDIDPDPGFLNRMLEFIDEAIADSLEDYAMQIATDYVPAPPEGFDEDAYEDAMAEQVLHPLMDRITNHIIAAWITG